MKYRDAKKLQPRNAVVLKNPTFRNNGKYLFVKDIEILWAVKRVRINCLDELGFSVVVYNEDVD